LAVSSREVSVQQTQEGLAVAGLVAGHLMDGVVDGVQIELLGSLGQGDLASGGAVLGLYAHLQVLLGGVGDDLAQHLGKLRSMLGLFKTGLVVVVADFGITLAVCHAGHGQIHADLGALAGEVGAQAFLDVLGTSLAMPTTCSAAQVISSFCSVNLEPGTPHWGHFSGGFSPS
jgi:hypothetical protein